MSQHDPNQHPPFQQPQPTLPDPYRQPKRKHRGRTALIVIGSVIGGLIVLAALAPSQPANEAVQNQPAVSTPVDNGPTPDPVVTPTNKPTVAKTAPKPVEQAPKVACVDQEDRNAPCTIQVGKPFQLGKHLVMAGWKVTSEYGTMGITGKAKNTGDKASAMFVEVKFLSGDEVLADVTCTSDSLEPGQTQTISCFSGDDYTKAYKRVTVEATF
jgi:hypothetical protein